MAKLESYWAIGLMSGTSLDGIDVALVRTDGIHVLERGPWLMLPFEDAERHTIREAVHGRGDIPAIENMLTRRHAEAVRALLKSSGFKARDVRVVGFPGQTIAHRPQDGITWQIGNGSLLAELIGIDVVADFRRRDVAAGGQGAPLVPLYHAALAQNLALPIVVLNLGGIANVTWVGRSEHAGDDILSHDILALDTGPGNVLLNEWALKHRGAALDEHGAMALAGAVDADVLARMMEDSFFAQYPPKSLDRHYFSLDAVAHLSAEDGAATLTAFTAASVAAAARFFPVPATEWYVTGGGRHNPAIMVALRAALPAVHAVEKLGWEGDALEAQAFAYLAVRSLHRLPLTVPTTTGTNRAVTGGALHLA